MEKKPRFPRAVTLLECLIDLELRVVPMRDATRRLAERLSRPAPRFFEYKAPSPKYTRRDVKRGAAREEGRCSVSPEPPDEEWNDVVKRFQGSVEKWREYRSIVGRNVFDVWARNLDAFHVEFRLWRSAIEAARTAIDQASDELDQGAKASKSAFELPSVLLREAIDQLSASVPYFPDLEHHGDYPPAETAWADAIESNWKGVRPFIQRLRLLADMYSPSRVAREKRTTPGLSPKRNQTPKKPNVGHKGAPAGEPNKRTPSSTTNRGDDEAHTQAASKTKKKQRRPPKRGTKGKQSRAKPGALRDGEVDRSLRQRKPSLTTSQSHSPHDIPTSRRESDGPPESPEPGGRGTGRIRVDVLGERIEVDGKPYVLTGDAIRLIECVVNARGKIVQGHEIKKKHSIARADRAWKIAKKKLPEHLHRLIVVFKGTGGGYRLGDDFLT